MLSITQPCSECGENTPHQLIFKDKSKKFLCTRCERVTKADSLFFICGSSMGEYRFRDKGNGKIDVLGIDFGPYPEVLPGGIEFKILRAKGHNAWSGIGQTAYYETTYYLVTFSGEYVFFLAEVQPGKYWRRGIQALIEYYHDVYLPWSQKWSKV